MDSATQVARQAPTESPPVVSRMERRRAARRVQSPWMPWVVALVTLVLRLLTAANGPTDWDSAQYAAAVGHFDVTHGQPQPPGYWLYVLAGRLVHQVTGVGTIHSLVATAVVASAAAAGLTALAGSDLGGRWVGVAAGAVVATCPFAWFSGSIVATYSFDMMAGALLIMLAWRARPGSWHGVAAAIALGGLAGFRQSIIQSFAILALIAVVGSTRRWSRLGLTVVAGAVAVAAWLVPLSLSQPGGFSAWLHATHTEASGAAAATSVLDHAVGGATNLGTFASFTVVALAPLAVVALLGGAVLGIFRLADSPARSRRPPETWPRPWYQTRTAVLAAAVVPPMALVALVQFAKGGYLLAYLPGAVIALLLPLGALARRAPGWRVVTSLGVIVVVALGAQRFLGGNGVLPQRWVDTSGAAWLGQPRYQAPYADTRVSIRTVDAIDSALHDLAPSVRSGSDVVVFDTVDGGADIYRNAGWELPTDRVALIAPGSLVYNQLHGALYYASGDAVAVGPSGVVLLVASPALAGLATLTAQGTARSVATPQPIGGFRVWAIPPGASVLGVRVTARPGARPLGTGI